MEEVSSSLPAFESLPGPGLPPQVGSRSEWIFEQLDYKKIILKHIERLPNAGRGWFSSFGRRASMQSSNLSQVFSGVRHLSPEQAEVACEVLELTEDESDYFLLLVEFARAGTEKRRARLSRQIKRARERRRLLSERLPSDRKLTDSERAIFYSSWMYSAVHVLSSIRGKNTVAALASHLGLPKDVIQKVVDFLLEHRFCERSETGIAPATAHTHLAADSPLVARHHGNWRVKAMERHPALSGDELAYSVQLSISKSDANRVRELCLKLSEDVRQIVDPSPCETGYALNLDWFRI